MRMVGKKYGYIDNLLRLHLICSVVLTLVGGETDPDLYCDLESPCSELLIDGRWGATSGGRFAPNSYSPRVDSTLSTSTGHYLYIASYTSASGRIQTQIKEFQDTNKCLSFYYFMNGPERTDRIGNIKVWLSMGQGDKVKQFWKDIIGNYGAAWQQVHINLPRGRYYVVIEAYLIDYNDDRIIAIDDFNISSCAKAENSTTSTEEPPEAPVSEKLLLNECDFENSHMCGYSNGPKDKFKWQRVTAGDMDIFPLPHADKTYGNFEGHYIYAVAPPSEGAAKLVSPTFSVPEDHPYCLDFMYNFTLRDTATRFFVYNISEGHVAILWSSDDVAAPAETEVPSEWSWGALPLYPGQSTLVFELRTYALEWLDTTAYFALDDIKVTRCDLLRNIPKPPPHFSMTFPSVFPTRFTCDFEDGTTCGAQNERLFAHSWVVEENGYTNVYKNPETPGSYFVYFEPTPLQTDSRRSMASLKLPRIWTYEKSCLQFQYFMDGNSDDELEIRISGKVSPYSRKQLWNHVGSNGGQWQWVLIRLPYTDFNLHLRAKRVSTHPVRLAVDDVMVDLCEKLLTISMPNEVFEPNEPIYNFSLSAKDDTTLKPHVNEAVIVKWRDPNKEKGCECDCSKVCGQKVTRQSECSTSSKASPVIYSSMVLVLLMVSVVLPQR